MLSVTIPGVELFDDDTQTFSQTESQVLQLEHSLVSISKWESKWKKSFFGVPGTKKTGGPETQEEFIDYIRCMTLNEVPDDVYVRIPQDVANKIVEYMHDPMTATTIRERDDKKKNGRRNRFLTSELIYSQMIALGIPEKFETWHINRLLVLIKVCDLENGPREQMTKKEQAEFYRASRQIKHRR